MATLPKSPRTPSDKDDTTFWEKLGTLGRKKKIKEGKTIKN
jgi:hypothetical protein